MLRNPVVSIVMPAKDRGDFIGSSISSVTAQTYPNWELIVVDDGSTDATLAVVREFLEADARISLIHRSRFRQQGGAQVCRNIGMRHASGAYVIFLDSDDLLLPGCLAGRVACMEETEGLQFAVFQCRKFNGDLTQRDPLWCPWFAGQDDIDAFLENRVPWQTTGPIWRRSALVRVGDWDEGLVIGGHDYEYHVRALSLGLSYTKVSCVDYGWRLPRNDSLSSFEGFRRLHREGVLMLAQRKSLGCLAGAGLLNARRRRLSWGEAVRLTIASRTLGGGKREAVAHIRWVGALCKISVLRVFEAVVCHVAWYEIRGNVVALSYISRRYPQERATPEAITSQ